MLSVFTLQIHHWEKRRNTQASGVWHKDIYKHPQTGSGRTDRWEIKANPHHTRSGNSIWKSYSQLSFFFRQSSRAPTEVQSHPQSRELSSSLTVSGESSLSLISCHFPWMIPKSKKDSSDSKMMSCSNVLRYCWRKLTLVFKVIYIYIYIAAMYC